MKRKLSSDGFDGRPTAEVFPYLQENVAYFLLPVPSIPPALRAAVYERDGYRCVDCGTGEDLSCDHVIPESLGGPTTLANLVTRCVPCNRRKGVRLLP